MESDRLKLQSPWVIAKSKLSALFGEDRGIKIESDGDRKVRLLVEDARKAEALARLLPDELEFGNVAMRIVVVPGNKGDADGADGWTTADTLAIAFEGNPVVKQIRPVSKGLFRNLTYCVFRNEVVQFFADRLDDINGFWSGLMEDIARDLLTEADDVFFCTAAREGLAAPLGEWP